MFGYIVCLTYAQTMPLRRHTENGSTYQQIGETDESRILGVILGVIMKADILLTITDRHRVNTENVRITGHTLAGEEYTFHVRGENAWWFESFLSEGTQINISPIETYAIYTGTQEKQIRIPPENTIKVEKAK